MRSSHGARGRTRSARAPHALVARNLFALAPALLLAVLAAPGARALTIRTVADSGDTAPGTGGAVYEGFALPVINQSGQVAFTATLVNGGPVDATNDLGMWSEGSGSLALVERRGSPAPGTASNFQTAIVPPALNDAGQVAFSGSLQSGGGNGVWHEGSGSLALTALSGSQADDVPAGQNWRAPFSKPAFNDAGQVAFHAQLQGTGVTTANDAGVWTGGPTGALTLAARKGDAAPGAGGAAFESFGGTLTNAAGGVAFGANLDDGGNGVWAGPATGVSLAARDGSTAPGTGGAVFAGLFDPDYNDSGEVAFQAGLEVGTAGVTFGDDQGIWSGAPGGLALVAREGDGAPDTGGRSFESFSGPLLNDAGETVFRGFLTTGTGIFIGDGMSLQKVVASGDTAPGTEIAPGLGDATFGGFTDYAFNDLGQVALEAVLSGVAQGVTGSNDGSLWLIDANGNFELVVREGDSYSFGPGDLAIVESIDLFGDAEALGRALNDRGWITFHLTFTDGREGVFAAIPEPGSGALLALGLAALAARRARRRQDGGSARPD